eukprot:gnl/Ergobibamus_cyprinoides/1003.p1 GENE.gnl/Ergobibamus_cyprinoides/1003~~gnl/Ergobibamus_cyprinoides/1003.p1  ORF type:complete len:131 (+),score=63.72 gnl/Ergobibamus_cyprinoides/1003:166-558(+)
MRDYHVGDYVDVHMNGAQQKGMTHKYYHGKTGVVFNVTRRAVGVEMPKVVGHRQIMKRVNVRLEHVKLSNCRKAHTERVAANEAAKLKAKETGVRVCLKRVQEQPREAHIVKTAKTGIVDMAPIPYDFML